MSDGYTEVPRLWLSSADPAQKTCLDSLIKNSKTGGDSLAVMRTVVGGAGLQSVDSSQQINVSPGSPMLATPGSMTKKPLTLVLINQTASELQLSDPVTYKHSSMWVYPVVKKYTDSSFTTQATVSAPGTLGQTMSVASFDDDGNSDIWIDSARALGADAASVGVFRFRGDATPFFGSTCALRLAGSGKDQSHIYLAAENNMSGSCGAVISANDHGSASDFYDKCCDDKDATTCMESTLHLTLYCATHFEQSADHLIVTALISDL